MVCLIFYRVGHNYFVATKDGAPKGEHPWAASNTRTGCDSSAKRASAVRLASVSMKHPKRTCSLSGVSCSTFSAASRQKTKRRLDISSPSFFKYGSSEERQLTSTQKKPARADFILFVCFSPCSSARVACLFVTSLNVFAFLAHFLWFAPLATPRGEKCLYIWAPTRQRCCWSRKLLLLFWDGLQSVSLGQKQQQKNDDGRNLFWFFCLDCFCNPSHLVMTRI